ncbi:MAG: hypothetical protein WBC67_17810 [Candidatus Acidiferrales bacterium]
MALTTLIQIIAAALGVIGSLFFTIGIVRQSPAAMAQLAGTYWNSNPYMVPALAAQKADYVFGGVIIALTFVVQLMSFLATPTTTIAVGARSALVIAIPATVVVFVILYRISKRVAIRFERQIRHAIAKAEAEAAAAVAAQRARGGAGK